VKLSDFNQQTSPSVFYLAALHCDPVVEREQMQAMLSQKPKIFL